MEHPPSPELLRWLLNAARPESVYVCSQYAADDLLSAVLRAVAGMCKYALNHPHQVTPPVANAPGGVVGVQGAGAPVTAAPTSLLDVNRMKRRGWGSREAIIRQALLWMEARGEIYLIEWQAGDTVRIAAGDNVGRSGPS